MRWIETETNSRYPVSAARVEPMPTGPYFVVQQHMAHVFDGKPWSFLLGHRYGEYVHEQATADVAWGQAVFADVDGVATIVAYHFDCSD